MKHLRIFAIFCVLLTAPSYAALPNSTVYNVHHAGSNNNGGCYITGSTGTDFSNQDAAQYTFTTLTSANGTTNPSIVASVSHSFVATDVGNCLHVTAGTNWTQGFYRIVSVLAGAATLDRQVGAAAALTNGTFAVGGALATLPSLITQLAACGGCTANVKGDAVYTTAIQVAFAFTGSPGQQVSGFTTTPGDGGTFTIQATAGIGGSPLVNLTGQGVLRNVVLDLNNQTPLAGLTINANSYAENVEVKNAGEQRQQFQLNNNSLGCSFCQAHDVAGNTLGIALVNFGAAGGRCNQCTIYNVTGTGTFVFNMPAGQCTYCVIAGVTGAGSAGFKIVPSAGVATPVVDHSIVYNLNGDAVQITDVSNVGTVTNSVFDTVVNGINNTSGTTLRSGDFPNDCNFTFNISGTAYLNVTAGAHSQALGTDPFVSPGTRNFVLNNTAGGGSVVTNGGCPASLPGVTGTGFPSGGGLQPKVINGGASSVIP